jgi:succinate dehydrogenase / fumarate reductase cytochrome b subunit
MQTSERPLSPHLQIYRWQLTMTLSIAHRATGIALAVGTLLLVWWLVAAATSPEAYADAAGFMRSWLGVLLLIGWSFSLFYHLCAGIRHLVWDTGYGLDIKSVYQSGWTVVVVSIGLTLLAWAAALVQMGRL